VWHVTCMYLVILLYLGISLEGKLVEFGGVYLIFIYFMELWHGQNPNSPLSPKIFFVGVLEDWLLSLMSTLVMGFGPQD
jgi:hypothetical protein